MAIDREELDPSEDDEPENQIIKGIRDAQKRAEKDAKKAQQERDQLASKLAEYEARDKETQVGASEAFKTVGLSTKHAQLYLREFPEGDVTEERARALAEKFDLATGSQAPVRTWTAPPAGGQAPDAGSTQKSVRELDEMFKRDPERAATELMALMKSGNAKFDNQAAQDMADEIRR